MITRKANIFDIRSIDPATLSKSIYAVDTNVLYWMHYSRCYLNYNNQYKLNVYPDFLTELINNGSKIITTIYNITELFNIIEKHEYKIFSITNNNINKKRYRLLPKERSKVKKEIDVVYSQIKTLYEIKDFGISIIDTDDFINEFENHSSDNFDYIIVKYLKSIGIYDFVADDCDYFYIDGINLYTANNQI